jgi:hypothetical protein
MTGHSNVLVTEEVNVLLFEGQTKFHKHITHNNYVDVGLLGCNTVWTYRYKPMFGSNKVSPSSALRLRQHVTPNVGIYFQIHFVIQSTSDIFTVVKIYNLRFTGNSQETKNINSLF